MPPAERKGSPGGLWPFLLLLVLLALVWLLRGRLHLDGATLREQLHTVSWTRIGLGVAVIYGSLVLRAARWAALLPPEPSQTLLRRSARLVAPQFIGFGAVALFGRVVDLARPYLIARRLQTSVASQLAVYSIERAFDLAAAAILFSTMLLFVPPDTPHRETFVRSGLVSVAATIFLIVFTLAVRFAGDRLASFARGRFGRLGTGIADKILEFRGGLAILSSAKQLILSLALSLLIWLLIAFAYVFTARSLTATPELAGMTLPAVMLLLAFSMGASLLQLPVLGWFTQTAALAAAFTTLYGVPVNPATVCALLTVVVNTLSVIPAGVVAARAGGTSLSAMKFADAKTHNPL